MYVIIFSRVRASISREYLALSFSCTCTLKEFSQTPRRARARARSCTCKQIFYHPRPALGGVRVGLSSGRDTTVLFQLRQQ
jgi:hypothetical protein